MNKLHAAWALFSLPLALPWPIVALAQVPTQALPTGPSVVQGTAHVQRQGSQLTITNSANAVLNWQSFSIGTGASVRFEQPHSSSAVLNRILGQEPSSILGQLSSNGKVWLLNPNGVLFGRDARVDVGGLVASTMNLSDQDWARGLRHLVADERASGIAPAGVTNQGVLRASSGGRIVLASAGGVHNEGLIEARGGEVLLAAGRSIDLADTRAPQVQLRVQAPQGEVLNLGRIEAAAIDVQAAIVNQQGLLSAQTLSGEGGRIELHGTQRVALAAGSRVSADGQGQGGRVRVDAGRAGTLLASGELSADGLADTGRGGRIELLGAQVGLLDGSATRASGGTRGGTLLVGGGLQGQDREVPNAQSSFVAPQARLSADATVRGDGGRVIVWSDKATRAFGRFSVQGGPQGGDGGLVETSGGWLDARPAGVDTRAPRGRAGQWLIDPNDLTITQNGPDASISTGPVFETTADAAVISIATLASALNSGSNVSLATAAVGGLEPGDIHWRNATLSVAPAAAVSLTLLATRDIRLDGAVINASGAPLDVTLVPAGGGVGGVEIRNSSVSLALGSFSVSSGLGHAGLPVGVRVSNSSLLAPNGAINLTGTAHTGTDWASPPARLAGVWVDTGSTLSAATLNLQGTLTSGADLQRDAIRVQDSTLTATNGLTLTGNATATQTLAQTRGSNGITAVSVANSSLSLVPGSGPASGSLNLSGTLTDGPLLGAGPWDTRHAVLLDGATVTATGGAVLQAVGTAIASGGSSAPRSGGTGSLRAITVLGGAVDGSGASALNLGGGGLGLIQSRLMAPNDGALDLGTSQGLTLDTTLTGSPGFANINTGTGPLEVSGSIAFTGSGSLYFSAGGDLHLGRIDGTQGLQLGTQGPVSALGQRVNTHVGTQLSSSATGTAILMTPGLGGSVTGANTLSTPNGHWRVYTPNPEDFVSTGLRPDFRQYGVLSPGAAVMGTGSALVYAVSPELTQAPQAPSRPYDGSLLWQNPGAGAVAGLRGGDTVSLLRFTDTPDVGTGKPMALGMGVNPGVQDVNGQPVYGYVVTGPLLGSVTPRVLSLSAVTAVDKAYDGSSVATLGGGLLSGLVPGQTLGLAYADGRFGSADAGTGKAVTGTASLTDSSTALASNYTLLSSDVSATASITPRPVLAGRVFIAPRAYDGSTTAALSGVELSGLVVGEDLGVTLASGGFGTPAAGTGKAVSGNLLLADGVQGRASNYVLSSASFSSTGDILPRAVSLLAVTGASKVYDGTREGRLTGGILAGLVPGEDLGLQFSNVSFARADAGTDIGLTGTVTLSDGTVGRAANYLLASPSAQSSASITPRPLSVSGVTVAPKVYDGSTAATASGGTLTGLVAGEDLTVALTAAAFADAHAGTGKVVTGQASLVSGSRGLASNYSLSAGWVASGDISPRPLTLGVPTGVDKVYDGSLAGQLVGGSLVGLVAGDDLTLSFSGVRFASANAATGLRVTGNATLGDGTRGRAADYQLLNPLTESRASITPRPLTLSGVSIAPKVYDGSVAASAQGGTLTGLVAGEDLSVVHAEASFDNPNVGTGKAVTGQASLVSGARGLAANYSLSGAWQAVGDISARPLTLAGVTATSKVYDGTVQAQVSGGALEGLLPGQSLLVTQLRGQFADAQAGTGKAVSVTAQLADAAGGLASNYRLTAVATPVTADITPAWLSYVANPALATVGVPLPVLSGTVTGFVAGETLGTATRGTLTFSTPATPAAAPGSYAIRGGGLSAANYRFQDAPQNETALVLKAAEPQAPADTRQRLVEIPTVLFPTPVASTPSVGRVADATAVLGTVVSAASTVTTSTATSTVAVSASTASSVPTSGTPTAAPDVGPVAPPAAPPAASPEPARPQTTFAAIPREALTQAEIAGLLAARSQLKRVSLADALQRLALNPALADAPACVSLAQVDSGNCLLTDRLRSQSRVQVAPLAAPPQASVPGVVPAATGAAPAVTTAAAPTAPPPASVSAAVTAGQTQPAAAAPPSLTARADTVLPNQRRVRVAVLPEIQRKVAVLIGIDRYTDARIPALQNAGNDAQAVAATLERSLGYETLVLRDASRAEILRTLNRLALQLEPQDSVIIYYAGHGERVDSTGQGYWQPADADASRPETWISNHDIGRLMRLMPARQVALVSDSCFSGSLLGEERIRGVQAGGDPRQLMRGRAAVVMTSGGNEPVFDAGRNGHSPFAWNLMQALQKVPSWSPGSNLFEAVRFAVAREMPQRPQYGSSALGGHERGNDYVFEQRQLDSER